MMNVHRAGAALSPLGQKRIARVWLLASGLALLAGRLPAAEERLPHHQDVPPGPALEPAEAIARMSVPPGFQVELVAAEPDLINPVAMTFDDQGRIWVTESLEYPRLEEGPGQDRVKVLEDTDRDGRVDRVTLFAEGLNIPSGIAVGYGGVWVANAPDLLFLADDDGDLKADRREVVVTGFGRRDVHELPSALGWGPDGWLYGLNGVFNPSVVRQDDREYRFTCAVWRVEPRSRRFELFCEGTSNPWGLAWDDEGSAFLSACVIDHLWHVVETGQYLRQAGAAPPYAWRQGSIVDHLHQKAAYCGLCYFDGDAFPAEYRDRLLMGNIHGGCLNVDRLEPRGATYQGLAEPDLLVANDAWFMPVSQQEGPDGCLYILDWYDRYHCYQDARRDPEGIERGRGRLYRLRYGDAPRAPVHHLAQADDQALLAALSQPGRYYRDRAQRLLAERRCGEVRDDLQALVLSAGASRKTRLAALFALVGAGPLPPNFQVKLLENADPALRAWGVRAAGSAGQVDHNVAAVLERRRRDPDPRVLLQMAIAAGKIAGNSTLEWLADAAESCGDDPVVPAIVWQNLLPRLPQEGDAWVARILANGGAAPAWRDLVPRTIERLSDAGPGAAEAAGRLLAGLAESIEPAPQVAAAAWIELAARRRQDRLSADVAAGFDRHLAALAQRALDRPPSDPLHLPGLLWSATTGSAPAQQALRGMVTDDSIEPTVRGAALETLLAGADPAAAELALSLVTGGEATDDPLRATALVQLARLNRPADARLLLDRYETVPGRLRAQLLDLLTEEPAWATALLDAIDEGRFPPAPLLAYHLRKLALSEDDEIRERARARFGSIRTGRDPAREATVNQVRELLRAERGEAAAGWEVFRKSCAQCHRLHGQGEEVGPDLTGNGRNSFEQLLSNVIDPSLVIGPAYQAWTLLTGDGRVLAGLLVENSPQRVTLKLPGGRVESVPRDQVEELIPSELSLMPEGLEKQLSPREMRDLFALLVLDRPPDDPQARRLPDAP